MTKEILIFLMKSGLVISLMVCFYQLFLRKETFFAFNRFYLLLTLILSTALPFIHFSSSPETIANINRFQFVGESIDAIATQVVATPVEARQALSIFSILAIIYFAGWILLLLVSAKDIFQIYRLRKTNPVVKDGTIRIINTPGIPSAFSLLNHIFISTEITDNYERMKILAHEKRHIQLFHTLDLIIVEFFVLLHWFNPFIYLLRNALKEVHEYQADQQFSFDKEEFITYQKLLVSQVETKTSLALTSSFNSLTLKRLKMMTRNKSNKIKLLWMLLLIPVITTLTLSFSTAQFPYPISSGVIANDTTVVINNVSNLKYSRNDSVTSYVFKKGTYDLEFAGQSSLTINVDNFDDVLIRINDSLVPINELHRMLIKAVSGANVVTGNDDWNFSGENLVIYYDDMEWRANEILVKPSAKQIELIGDVSAISRFEQAKNPPTIYPVEKVEGVHISSGFGDRMDPIYKVEKMHNAVDIAAPIGTKVFATAEGTVRLTDFKATTHGNYIIIDHDPVYSTFYSHLSEILVKEGQELKAGDVIGKVGNTGRSVSPHLHYEIKKNGKNVDPKDYFPPWKNK
ncbi:MAG: peptidoglycan DD-metalloendopeptidase family protein [Bacteroidales bacterium]|nr:peptidoglycan DD-metalloendopeptidase family protein [Bacteroidales bacterium]MCF8456991.1 peptidoglycan DD-metalloendopeptidase family protein [Bacteroidales bacterium]